MGESKPLLLVLGDQLYPSGDWCDVLDGLYWRFVRRNRDELAHNPRTSRAVHTLDRMKASRRDRILVAADDFIHRVTVPRNERQRRRAS